jgi:hypothetical protein
MQLPPVATIEFGDEQEETMRLSLQMLGQRHDRFT